MLTNQVPQPNLPKVSLGMGSERNETAKKTPFPPILIFRGISMLNARQILPSHFSCSHYLIQTLFPKLTFFLFEIAHKRQHNKFNQGQRPQTLHVGFPLPSQNPD